VNAINLISLAQKFQDVSITMKGVLLVTVYIKIMMYMVLDFVMILVMVSILAPKEICFYLFNYLITILHNPFRNNPIH